jgi:cytochrome P450
MWALYSLALIPVIQSRLREELLACPSATPSMETLASLPYLDAVVRETLRLHAAVPSTIRMAEKDDVIPLSEPFVDTRGVRCDSIRSVGEVVLHGTRSADVVPLREYRIKKGEGIFIPILSINRSTAIWGPDAHEFKYVLIVLCIRRARKLIMQFCVYSPGRWFNLPESANNVPGVWGNMLTFLGGARSCIGYRFALIE